MYLDAFEDGWVKLGAEMDHHTRCWQMKILCVSPWQRAYRIDYKCYQDNYVGEWGSSHTI